LEINDIKKRINLYLQNYNNIQNLLIHYIKVLNNIYKCKFIFFSVDSKNIINNNQRVKDLFYNDYGGMKKNIIKMLLVILL